MYTLTDIVVFDYIPFPIHAKFKSPDVVTVFKYVDCNGLGTF